MVLRCLAAGFLLAASIPPWGWWPLAFVGVAVLDELLGETAPLAPTRHRRLLAPGAGARFRRMWLVTAAWLAPAMLWMWDMTPPGYLGATAAFSAYYGAAAAFTPPGPVARRAVLPGAFILAEAARWYWPFGGVPLANLALGQVEGPLGATARLAGPLLVIMLVIVVGQACVGLLRPQTRRIALTAFGFVLLLLVVTALHPRSAVVRDADVAMVQGGGPVRTRSSGRESPIVLARHAEASRAISENSVDFILWPENVVNPGQYLSMEEATVTVAETAARHNAPVLAGWFHQLDDDYNVNYQSVITSTGVTTDRYDKVRMVPFGEFVPLRSVVDSLGYGDTVPARDALPGTEPPVLDTPAGPAGVSISWEAFFSRRARDAVNHGAQILTNPTNGSSFWLTQVHTQQVASNQLRAIENDRWLLMVAPTGLSATIKPDGTVAERSNIGERRVLFAHAEMRTGRTLSAVVGPWPAVIYGVVAVATGIFLTIRDSTRRRLPQENNRAD